MWKLSEGRLETDVIDVYEMSSALVKNLEPVAGKIIEVIERYDLKAVLQIVLWVASDESKPTPAIGFEPHVISFLRSRVMNKLNPVVLVSLILLTGCSGTKPDLGVNNGELMPCPKTPNCVNSQAADEGHYIKPLHFSGTRQEAKERLLQILKSEKRTKILAAHEHYIRVEFTSSFFRFVDDVEFYFPKEQAGEKLLHIRSASRVGYSDLGANRKRIEKIRSNF
jgi:uncharacterized protein (DUF1499 family)